MDIVNYKKQCEWSGCSNPAGPAHFVFGRAYCPQHYFDGVELAFINEIKGYGKTGGQKQSNKFDNLFKRYIEGLCEIYTPPGLANMSPTKIIGRLKLSYLGQDKIEFSMERHGSFIPLTFYYEIIVKDRKINQTSWNPHYVDVSQFAELFSLTMKKVRNLIREGKLEAVRARNLQAQWYALMLASGREYVRNPFQPGTSTLGNAYMIPFGEVQRYSKLYKPNDNEKSS